MSDMSMQVKRTVFLPKGSPGIYRVKNIRGDVRNPQISSSGGKTLCRGDADLLLEYLALEDTGDIKRSIWDEDSTPPATKPWQAMITMPFEALGDLDLECPPLCELKIIEVQWQIVAARALEVEFLVKIIPPGDCQSKAIEKTMKEDDFINNEHDDKNLNNLQEPTTTKPDIRPQPYTLNKDMGYPVRKIGTFEKVDAIPVLADQGEDPSLEVFALDDFPKPKAGDNILHEAMEKPGKKIEIKNQTPKYTNERPLEKVLEQPSFEKPQEKLKEQPMEKVKDFKKEKPQEITIIEEEKGEGLLSKVKDIAKDIVIEKAKDILIDKIEEKREERILQKEEAIKERPIKKETKEETKEEIKQEVKEEKPIVEEKPAPVQPREIKIDIDIELEKRIEHRVEIETPPLKQPRIELEKIDLEDEKYCLPDPRINNEIIIEPECEYFPGEEEPGKEEIIEEECTDRMSYLDGNIALRDNECEDEKPRFKKELQKQVYSNPPLQNRAKDSSQPPGAHKFRYCRVFPGEDLADIAYRAGVSPALLASKNKARLDQNNGQVKAGMFLIIP